MPAFTPPVSSELADPLQVQRENGELTQSTSGELLDVVIIGAGFGGIGMGIALKEAGCSFVILEKSEDLGGVWHDNTYPGAACDVPSNLYSYSFEQHYKWSKPYAPQGEILGYLKWCANKYQLRPHIRFGVEVVTATFDESQGVWQIRLASGAAVTARVVISACGQLSRPALPKVAGLDSFGGVSFHSARWNHTYELAGRRVAVIGTGASAIQFVPPVAAKVAKLHLFQRSPPWILPKSDSPFGSIEQKILAALPSVQTFRRGAKYLELETRFLGFYAIPSVMSVAGWMARRHLRSQVSDLGLRDKLTPNYPMGCKRILFSNNYYPAISQSNVEVVTTDISHVQSGAVVTRDGKIREVDAIIYGTGFQATDFLAPMQISGIDGRKLHEVWSGGADAYLGMAVSGFPNLFILYGPNTNLGHNSIVYMLESQINYIVRALKVHRENGYCLLNVRADVQQAYSLEMQRRLRDSIWTKGCSNWYVNAEGKSTNNWPGHTFEYRRRTSVFQIADYDM